VSSTKKSGWELSAAGITSAAGMLQSVHPGVAHLTLVKKADMFLHAAMVADGQLPQAFIDLIQEPLQAQ
jgi:hypothetical protein